MHRLLAKEEDNTTYEVSVANRTFFIFLFCIFYSFISYFYFIYFTFFCLLRAVEKIRISKRSRRTFSRVLRDRSNGNLKLMVVRVVLLDYPEDEHSKLLRNASN